MYVESKKKKVQMNLFTEQKKSHRGRKETHGYQAGRSRGVNWEAGTEGHAPLYAQQITNKDLLYSTGDSVQHSEGLQAKRL